MNLYRTLLLLFGWYGIASSQTVAPSAGTMASSAPGVAAPEHLPYTPSDGAMAPALVSGIAYTVAPPDSLQRSRIAVFTRNGSSVARRVTGMPGDKEWALDADFRKRCEIKWGFHSIQDNLGAFFSSPATEAPEEGYQWSHFASVLDDTVFTVIITEWEAAPEIGDSLYYMDADAAGFDDSAEWGYIHLRDITGIILPSEEEE